jgi:hypothetical protein
MGSRVFKRTFIFGLLLSASVYANEASFKRFVHQLKPTGMMGQVFNLGALEKSIGMKVFLKGPHKNGRFNFYSASSFGHYNPEFLKFVTKALFSKGSGPTISFLQKNLPKFYDFKFRLSSLSAAYCHLKRNPTRLASIKSSYLAAIAKGEPLGAFSSGKFSDWGGQSFDAADIAFWARRDIDGTYQLFTKFIAKALKHLDFEAFQAKAACFKGKQALVKKDTNYFIQDSYQDHLAWGNASVLGCRRKLIESHNYVENIKQAKGSARYGAIKHRDSIQDQNKINRILKAAGCQRPNMKGPHYLFSETRGKFSWKPVNLKFRLDYIMRDRCSLNRMVLLPFKDNVDVSNRLLYAEGVQPKGVSALNIRVPEFKKDLTKKRWILRSARIPKVKRLFKKIETEKFCGEVNCGNKTQTVINNMSLWVVFKNGKKVMLEQRKGVGKYSYSEPKIMNIRVVDPNMDGWPDFIYDIDNKGRRLTMTRNHRILKVIKLRSSEYSGVGGC